MDEKKYTGQEIVRIADILSYWDKYQTAKDRLAFLEKVFADDYERFLTLRAHINHEGTPSHVAYTTLTVLEMRSAVSKYVCALHDELDPQNSREAKLRSDLEKIVSNIGKV